MHAATETTTGHQFQEHTGELRLELFAPSREELFGEAGRALAELMLGERLNGGSPTLRRVIEVRARDRASLLVGWLNELISLSEITKEVFTHFRVDHVDDTEVRAIVDGVTPELLQTAIKAATLHDVAVEPVQTGWRASVVLDV
jgi:SHS2 domain-containing protein